MVDPSPPLRYSLLADGASDRALVPIINWTLERLLIPLPRPLGIVDQFADLRQQPDPPGGLQDRIERVLRTFPCDLLFVHRDAEREALEARIEEVSAAAKAARADSFVAVVPMRMTEAWLLFDEDAIRQAAGNPNGTVELNLPILDTVELVPEPKEILLQALITASEKSGRRRKQFQRDLHARKARVAEYIEDFTPLRQLVAFQRFEADTGEALRELGY